VTVALAFSRARLSDVYTVLRGRDVDTGILDTKQRDSQFARLEQAQSQALDPTNWHEFLSCPERADLFRALGGQLIDDHRAVRSPARADQRARSDLDDGGLQSVRQNCWASCHWDLLLTLRDAPTSFGTMVLIF
jgi:hypothetical protein